MVPIYHRLTMLSTSVVCMSAESFDRWLAYQLDRRDMKPADFARKVGSRPGVVSHWLNGERTPSTQSADRIADVLGVDVDLVLTLAGHRPHMDELAADDPRTALIGLVRRLPPDHPGIPGVEAMLRAWVDEARKAKRR